MDEKNIKLWSDVFQVIGYVTIPALVIIGLDLFAAIFSNKLFLLHLIFTKFDFLIIYTVFAGFASTLWFIVISLLQCTKYRILFNRIQIKFQVCIVAISFVMMILAVIYMILGGEINR